MFSSSHTYAYIARSQTSQAHTNLHMCPPSWWAPCPWRGALFYHRCLLGWWWPQVGEARRMHEEGSRRAVDAYAGSTVKPLLSAGCNPRSGPWVTPTCGKVLAQQRTTGWTTSRCHKRTSNVSALPPSSPATPKGTAYCGTTGNCWLLVRP